MALTPIRKKMMEQEKEGREIQDLAFNMVREIERNEHIFERDNYLKDKKLRYSNVDYTGDTLNSFTNKSIENNVPEFNQEVANQLKEGWTDREETPWETHLRLSGGESKLFANEEEYNEFRQEVAGGKPSSVWVEEREQEGIY